MNYILNTIYKKDTHKRETFLLCTQKICLLGKKHPDIDLFWVWVCVCVCGGGARYILMSTSL